MKDYYWDRVSDIIGELLKKNITPQMSILEIGFGSGHFLEWLNACGYEKLHGIEIREEQYLYTKEIFNNKGLGHIDLIYGNVLEHKNEYDAIFSTGLLQCLSQNDRENYMRHISSLADIAIFTVPKIDMDRNIGSKIDTGVAGCSEYSTGNILYELSKCYSIVRAGIIDKNRTCQEEVFLYYICWR